MKYLVLTLLLIITACTPQQKPKAKKITFMTFNVENLFDTVDDPKKNDETFLPLNVKTDPKILNKCKTIEVTKWKQQCMEWDWNEKALLTKLERIAKVIHSVNSGNGPDIIFFQEVENKSVLERLRKEYLADLNYRETFLIEGSDARGIDTGIISRYPAKADPRLRPIHFSGKVDEKRLADTREILEVTIDVDGDEITLLNVHFPAPFHPAKMRKDAFTFLNKILENKEGKLVIAAGDFNLTSSEDAQTKTLDTLVAPHWYISQKIGCKSCKGTNYYPPKKSWSFLDMIFVAREGLKKTGWNIDEKSIQVFNKMDFQKRKGTPFAYKLPGNKGLSDHWPVVMTLVKEPPAEKAKN